MNRHQLATLAEAATLLRTPRAHGLDLWSAPTSVCIASSSMYHFFIHFNVILFLNNGAHSRCYDFSDRTSRNNYEQSSQFYLSKVFRLSFLTIAIEIASTNQLSETHSTEVHRFRWLQSSRLHLQCRTCGIRPDLVGRR
jgi:hypothetical protein